MSWYRSPRSGEEDLSRSSDDKMDTGSESFRSEDTPNSGVSSDSSEHNTDTHANTHIKTQQLSDSIIAKMSAMNLDSPKLENRPKHLGLSPPKFSSSLVLTTNHPLMSSPDDFPDVVPKKVKDEDIDNSLSSIEEDKPNGYFYDSSMNNSKNNLYFSENFTTADSQILDSQDNSIPPDVARVERKRKIIPKYIDKKEMAASLNVTGGKRDKDSNGIMSSVGERKQTLRGQSTPKVDNSAVSETEYFSGVSVWCDSPSDIGAAPNFSLPVQPHTCDAFTNEVESPDVVSWSGGDYSAHSQYCAHADPAAGLVALRPALTHCSHSHRQATVTPRRRIQVPPEEDDRCSVDSVSVSLGEEEDEPPELPDQTHQTQRSDQTELTKQSAHTHGDVTPLGAPRAATQANDSDDDTKRSSISAGTCSTESGAIPEYSLQAELRDERSWITVTSGGKHRACDMKVIEPFKRVLSHGGYDGGGAAIIVFSACHLPDTARPDYRYVMDHLFLYVTWTLDRLVTEEYVLVYLHGSAGRRMPSARWLHHCYTLIDRRLRKSLKHLYLVHPTFWLKCFVVATKPFVSSKFFRKLSYVGSLEALLAAVPVEPNAIPELVKQYDAHR